jgi:hypothetical protein
MRPETKTTAWPAIPVRVYARPRRILNLGQFVRSLVFAAFGVAAVVMIALPPARHDGGGAWHGGIANGPLTGGILRSPG